MPHDTLIGAPNAPWELGTRDAGSYATFTDVVGYFEWLGGRVSNATTARDKVVAAGHAIAAQENALVNAMLYGVGGKKGLADMPEITVIGGLDNPHREGLVSIVVQGHASSDIVTKLSQHGIRVHIRRADHYSGNILTPLGLDSCIRVSMCHYNTKNEVQAFLNAVSIILA